MNIKLPPAAWGVGVCSAHALEALPLGTWHLFCARGCHVFAEAAVAEKQKKKETTRFFFLGLWAKSPGSL